MCCSVEPRSALTKFISWSLVYIWNIHISLFLFVHRGSLNLPTKDLDISLNHFFHQASPNLLWGLSAPQSWTENMSVAVAFSSALLPSISFFFSLPCLKGRRTAQRWPGISAGPARDGSPSAAYGQTTGKDLRLMPWNRLSFPRPLPQGSRRGSRSHAFTWARGN